jgi:adenylyltransferase/sulfurtransferase
VLLDKPNAYGSIFRFEGQASVFATKKGPCYRCLYPEPPPPGLVPSCAEGGVLGVLPGIIGVIQATEAIKLITGIGEPLIGRFLIYDALKMRFRELKVPKDPDCPVCGPNPTVTKLIDYEQFCGIHPAAPEPTTVQNNATEISAIDLKRLDRGDARSSTSGAERVSDQPDRGVGPDPPGRRAAAVPRSSTRTTDRGALQDGRPQRKGG